VFVFILCVMCCSRHGEIKFSSCQSNSIPSRRDVVQLVVRLVVKQQIEPSGLSALWVSFEILGY